MFNGIQDTLNYSHVVCGISIMTNNEGCMYITAVGQEMKIRSQMLRSKVKGAQCHGNANISFEIIPAPSAYSNLQHVSIIRVGISLKVSTASMKREICKVVKMPWVYRRC